VALASWSSSMKTYGLDTGTTHNELVSLDGKRLTREKPVQAFKDHTGPVNDAKLAARAQAIADELDSRRLHPLGIDAPVALAVAGDCRPWERLARGFKTPASLDQRLRRGSRQQQAWHKLARLWSRVAFILTQQHGWRLWQGKKLPKRAKVLVEVYPRMSWLALAAFARITIAEPYGRTGCKDSILDGLGLEWTGSRNVHARDAAVCAITARAVLEHQAGYLGQPVQIDKTHRVLRGGGIAIPGLGAPAMTGD